MERPTSRSTKSASVSRSRVRRKTTVRQIEDGDLRYIWAAYRKGGLKHIDPVFDDVQMTPEEFSWAFADFVKPRFPGPVFFMTGRTGDVERPLGFALTFERGEKFMEVCRVVWFPWVSKRAILESTVNFLNALRRDRLVLFFAHQKDDEFFQKHIASRNVIRRIGVLHGLFVDAPASIFQTRRWGDW